MIAMSMPGLDAYLTADPFPRRRFRDRDEAVRELSAEIRADSDRMSALLEEDAAQVDEAELVAELVILRGLLAAPDSDTHAAGQLAIYRRDFRALAQKLADDEAGLIADGER